MSVGTEVKVASPSFEAEDAFELQDHEFTLDPDDASPTPQRRHAAPPPPPPRRAAVSGMVRPRTGSGVFTRPEPNVEAIQAEVSRLRAQLRARDAYLTELERALDERTRQQALAGIHTMGDVARLQGQLRGQSFRIAELESELRNANLYAAELRAAARSGEQPDGAQLQRVRGIGPRYASQLTAAGVERLAQIAAWTEADVARIATLLHITPGRIAREGWIDQARALSGSSAALDADA